MSPASSGPPPAQPPPSGTPHAGNRPAGKLPYWLLRRADQAAVAGLVVVCLGLSIAWWISRGGLSGRLLDIDRAAPQTAQFQVDINQADWPELTQLPGIGETLAKRIVQSRQTEGPFRDHHDLRRVRGIGPRTFDRLRPHLLPMPDQGTVAGR